MPPVQGYDDYNYGGGGYGGSSAPGGYGGPPGGGYPGERPAGGPGYGPASGGPDQASAGPRIPAAGAGQVPEEVWAANGYPVQGPNDWVMYKVKETGEPYYHNHRTNTTVWERPPEWPAN